MEDIRSRCNLMVDLSKFIFNKKILSKVVVLGYINQFCNYILSKKSTKIRRFFFLLEYIQRFRGKLPMAPWLLNLNPLHVKLFGDKYSSQRTKFSYRISCSLRFWQIHHWIASSSYILYTCKISRKLKINSYVINKLFKLQIFVV